MGVTKEETKNIAKLAQLSFSEAELDKITNDLNDILSYISRLNAIDTSSVEPLAHPVAHTAWMREDENIKSISRSEALKNAPQANSEYFLVPKVIK